jgi:hypothetical protein
MEASKKNIILVFIQRTNNTMLFQTSYNRQERLKLESSYSCPIENLFC